MTEIRSCKSFGYVQRGSQLHRKRILISLDHNMGAFGAQWHYTGLLGVQLQYTGLLGAQSHYVWVPARAGTCSHYDRNIFTPLRVHTRIHVYILVTHNTPSDFKSREYRPDKHPVYYLCFYNISDGKIYTQYI